MRKLQERLVLSYADQVEFIRFRDVALDAENEQIRLEIYIKRLKQKQEDALDEIERLFKKERS